MVVFRFDGRAPSAMPRVSVKHRDDRTMIKLQEARCRIIYW